jgi:hypothetical protein
MNSTLNPAARVLAVRKVGRPTATQDSLCVRHKGKGHRPSRAGAVVSFTIRAHL